MAPTFEAYRAELLRWSRQINLLSRRDPGATADALIAQCVDAFAMWWEASGARLASGGALRMFDLGSGGGLPAYVWLSLLAERGVAVSAVLVEPRAKRAWFLERLRQLPGAPTYAVAAGRWGEVAVPPGGAPDAPILFTLKALRLTESAVLAGLGAFPGGVPPAPGCNIELVRFRPAARDSSARLARELGIPAEGTPFRAGALSLESVSCRLRLPEAPGPDAAGLLVSRHVVAAPGG